MSRDLTTKKSTLLFSPQTARTETQIPLTSALNSDSSKWTRVRPAEADEKLDEIGGNTEQGIVEVFSTKSKKKIWTSKAVKMKQQGQAIMFPASSPDGNFVILISEPSMIVSAKTDDIKTCSFSPILTSNWIWPEYAFTNDSKFILGLNRKTKSIDLIALDTGKVAHAFKPDQTDGNDFDLPQEHRR